MAADGFVPQLLRQRVEVQLTFHETEWLSARIESTHGFGQPLVEGAVRTAVDRILRAAIGRGKARLPEQTIKLVPMLPFVI